MSIESVYLIRIFEFQRLFQELVRIITWATRFERAIRVRTTTTAGATRILIKNLTRVVLRTRSRTWILPCRTGMMTIKTRRRWGGQVRFSSSSSSSSFNLPNLCCCFCFLHCRSSSFHTCLCQIHWWNKQFFFFFWNWLCSCGFLERENEGRTEREGRRGENLFEWDGGKSVERTACGELGFDFPILLATYRWFIQLELEILFKENRIL